MIAWLVETLIATTGLLLLILLLRDPVRHIFGANVAYALWLLPALRLVVPPMTWLVPDTPALSHVTAHSSALSQLIRERVTQFDPTSALPGVEASAAFWLYGLAMLWLLGALAFAAWQVVSYRIFCRRVLSDARVRRSPTRGVKLLASKRVQGPLAFGLLKRFVIFPDDALARFDVEEHAMALAHELAHHRRGDLIANAFALGFLGLHWWNPVAWYAHRAFRVDQEMACDADVIDAIRDRGLGHAYGRALVKCAVGRREYSAICHLTTVDRLKRRLSMLSRKTPSMRRRYAGLALTGAVMLTGLALTASGEGVAAQVGARVSDAMPPARAVTPPSLPAQHQAHTRIEVEETTRAAATRADRLAGSVEHAERTAEKARHAAREAHRAAQDGAGRAHPAPPAPPMHPAPPAPPALAAIPPVPPVHGAAPWLPVPPAPPSHGARRTMAPVAPGHLRAVPTKAEIDAMVPIIEVTEGKGCTSGKEIVNTTERRVIVDGQERQKISIQICSKEHQRQVREQAVRGLREARNDIAREDELSDDTRRSILADLDRQIARIRAGKD